MLSAAHGIAGPESGGSLPPGDATTGDPRMSWRQLAVLAVAWFAACGGSRRPTAAIDPPPPDLSLEPQPGPLDPEQQAHLLRRTQWAVTPDDRRFLADHGLPAFLDRILDPLPEP